MLASAAFAQQAKIKIDTDRRIGEIDKLLFGDFAEHLGRMIYGGWAAAAELADPAALSGPALAAEGR